MAETVPAGGPNAAQIEYWNGRGSERWTSFKGPLDTLLAPIGERAMAAAGIGPGMDVLDVGCGTGATTVEIARRVGATGSVTGVDVSAPMLNTARERAAAEVAGVPIAFDLADVETRTFPAAAYDAAFSRLGVMFFRNPATAFANIRAALRPGGRLGFACWREAGLNPWAMATIRAAGNHLELPAPPGPEEPGAYSLKDAGRIRRILGAAGFSDVILESFKIDICMGEDLEDAVVNSQYMGPVATTVLAAPADIRERIADDVRETLRECVTDAGVMVGSASWIVSARNP